MEKNINIQEQYLKTFVETLRPQDPEIRKQVDIGYVIFPSLGTLKSRVFC